MRLAGVIPCCCVATVMPCRVRKSRPLPSPFEWLTEDERKQAWRDMVHQMREVFMRFFEEEGVAAQLGQEAAKKVGEVFIAKG